MKLIDESMKVVAAPSRGLLKQTFQKPTTLAVEIARYLREAIIRGEIRPGERLNEVNLTQVFGSSRAPIREGLRILEADGLVNMEPHRGAYVRKLSADGLREIFDTRLMIESYAILRGETTLTEERLQTMSQALMEARSALQEEAYEPWHQASLRFHDAIVALADNDYLQGMYEQVKRSVRSYQILLIQVPTQPMRSQADHENVLEALNHRDIPRALERLREHFGSIETTIRLNLG